MTDDLVERLRQNADMMRDGHQRNLTKLWHSDVVKNAAKDAHDAAELITATTARIAALEGALDGLLRSVDYRSGVIASVEATADMINTADYKLEKAIVAGRAALASTEAMKGE